MNEHRSRQHKRQHAALWSERVSSARLVGSPEHAHVLLQRIAVFVRLTAALKHTAPCRQDGGDAAERPEIRWSARDTEPQCKLGRPETKSPDLMVVAE